MVEVAVVVVFTAVTIGIAVWAQTRRSPDAGPSIDLLNRIDLLEIKARASAIEKRTWS